jgi:hypothetical protein
MSTVEGSKHSLLFSNLLIGLKKLKPQLFSRDS